MRALFEVTVAGTNITAPLNPILLALRVSDQAGTHSASASLEIDDSEGQIILPGKGAPMMIALGWQGEGTRPVFAGTVDDVRSNGGRSGGRVLSIAAKGIDTTGKAKEGQQRHWDDATVEQIVGDAAEFAGVSEIEIDPALSQIRRAYFEMRDESLIAMGTRLAREIGANFRIQGPRLILSRRAGLYLPAVSAAWGRNLHSWSIAPQLGRPVFGRALARWYDLDEAEWKSEDRETDLDAEPVHFARFARADDSEAGQQAGSDAETSERDSGDGSVVIDGNTSAVPDGLCLVSGTRAGVDGGYRIEGVDHEYSRSGFLTTLTLKHPQGDAGGDSR